MTETGTRGTTSSGQRAEPPPVDPATVPASVESKVGSVPVPQWVTQAVGRFLVILAVGCGLSFAATAWWMWSTAVDVRQVLKNQEANTGKLQDGQAELRRLLQQDRDDAEKRHKQVLRRLDQLLAPRGAPRPEGEL